MIDYAIYLIVSKRKRIIICLFFIYIDKYLSSIYYVPGISLGIGNTTVNKAYMGSIQLQVII